MFSESSIWVFYDWGMNYAFHKSVIFTFCMICMSELGNNFWEQYLSWLWLGMNYAFHKSVTFTFCTTRIFELVNIYWEQYLSLLWLGNELRFSQECHIHLLHDLHEWIREYFLRAVFEFIMTGEWTTLFTRVSKLFTFCMICMSELGKVFWEQYLSWLWLGNQLSFSQECHIHLHKWIREYFLRAPYEFVRTELCFSQECHSPLHHPHDWHFPSYLHFTCCSSCTSLWNMAI